MYKKIDARGLTCPLPVIKAKEAIENSGENANIEVLVDNEIAAQNLQKLANQKNCGLKINKISDKEIHVFLTSGEGLQETGSEEVCKRVKNNDNTAVVFSSQYMGNGNDELGAILVKSFIFAITKQDVLPKTLIFYNGGAWLTTEGSKVIEDIKALEQNGTEIITCGTCLDFYGIKDKLAVGSVSNMYEIAEKMLKAEKVIRP